jgi:hypothetical protein
MLIRQSLFDQISGALPVVFRVIQRPTGVRNKPPLTHGMELRPLQISRVLVLLVFHVAGVRLPHFWTLRLTPW